MKNKKYFTLVELLVVSVCISLIIGAIVIGIGGVFTKARNDTFKKTAIGIIDDIKKQLFINDSFSDGDYIFTSNIFEKGGDKSPWGDDYHFASNDNFCNGDGEVKLGDNVCKVAMQTCNDESISFIRINGNTVKICLTTVPNARFIDLVREEELLDK